MSRIRPLRLLRWFVRLGRDTRGGTAIEYGFIIALVVIAMLTSLIAVAGVTREMWGNISTKVGNAH